MSESGYEWEGVSDLTSFSESELKSHLDAFSEEEREVSYRRRVLQGRIDLIRAELVRRGSLSVSPDSLARALLGDSFRDYQEGHGGPDNPGERETDGEVR